ncbi:MAG: SDR family oxidoreductase [Planctomycetota bacterium]|nr:SDR family oxidoreductase [Planctomycetota bacterium]MDG2141986.1 SDR family oxidoreductase [Planctomycetota bacterium]
MTSNDSATSGDSAPAPLPPSPFAPQLFQGKRVFITGGGTGLGLEISRRLASLGAHVMIGSRNKDHHESFLAEAKAEGWSASAHVLDVRKLGDIADLVRELTADGPVDMLVNNAAGNFVCPAERLSEGAWRAVLGIVLDGTFYCTREFGKSMIANGGGVMLNVVATYAWTGMPGVVHSASAKAGVLAMTRTLAVEWARHKIRVNAIAPGPFESEGASGNLWPDGDVKARLMAGIPAGRFATASEVADHAVWLLSGASDYVTGECFTMDGGASLGRGMWEPGERVR